MTGRFVGSSGFESVVERASRRSAEVTEILRDLRVAAGRIRRLAVACICVFAATPIVVGAQVGLVVEGRVVDAPSSQGVPNAVVTLGEYGGVLTTNQGGFRFEGVERGEYTLTVRAFGYVDIDAAVTVNGDVNVTVELDPAPFALDSLLIEVSTFDFDGRVRDPRTDSNLYDALVRSDQGHRERSNWHGRFDLDDVYEDIPMRMIVTAFGYMPLDTTFVPDGEERYPFNVVPDPIAEKMIETQTQRLEERARNEEEGYRPLWMNPELDRSEIARYSSRGTLQTMLEDIYPMTVLRRVGCLIIDEQPLMPGLARDHVLQTTLPQELERTEILEFPHARGMLMLRVYTKRFFQQLVATNRPLRTPMVDLATRTCR